MPIGSLHYHQQGEQAARKDKEQEKRQKNDRAWQEELTRTNLELTGVFHKRKGCRSRRTVMKSDSQCSSKLTELDKDS